MQDKIFKVKVFEVTHKSVKYDVKIFSLLGYMVFVMSYLLVVFGRPFVCLHSQSLQVIDYS